MFEHLSIRNFALIDRLEVDFPGGFSVVTGETGAGKSIVFDAVGILVGQRASADMIRGGEASATVEGIFAVPSTHQAHVSAMLEELGIPASGELVLRRVISRAGSNRAWVNDTLASVAFLARLLEPMVQVVGQNEHLTLTRVETHRRFLDSAGTPPELLDQMATAYADYLAAKKACATLRTAQSDRAQRLEFLKYQRTEIDQLKLRAGEFAELEALLTRVRSLGKLRDAVGSATSALSADDRSAQTQLRRAADALSRAPADPRLDAIRQTLTELGVLVDDAARELSSFRADLEEDVDVDAIESRHEALKRAQRKYAADEAGLLEKAAAVGKEISALENFEESLAAAEAAEQKALDAAAKIARKLDDLRRKTAGELFVRVARNLADLSMPNASFSLAAAPASPALSAAGFSGVEILFSANAGEAPGPIGKVASGGELSRLMLALKAAISESDEVDTYIFDEVDTGIGGATATHVGRLLSLLGETRQVLCVTHLAQIASHGAAHYLAEKRVDGGRTISELKVLSKTDRLNELARMIGGEPTKATLASAKDMLNLAKKA